MFAGAESAGAKAKGCGSSSGDLCRFAIGVVRSAEPLSQARRGHRESGGRDEGAAMNPTLRMEIGIALRRLILMVNMPHSFACCCLSFRFFPPRVRRASTPHPSELNPSL